MDVSNTVDQESRGSRFHVEIRPLLPERLKRLDDLANDLYYSWNRDVRGLFRHLDEECWNASGHNPRVLLRRFRQSNLDAAARDPILLAEFRNVLAAYDTYQEQLPVTRIDTYLDRDTDLVAYFSAEFGFHESMPIYAGGLGILAADYCKAMSNLWVPFVGVGLLYHQGYFDKRIDSNGDQIAEYPYRNPEDLPVKPAVDKDGEEVRVYVDLSGRTVELKVWAVKVGKIQLYLLDSDVDANTLQDRDITAQLYGGNETMRLQQEVVLGVGGVRALRALGLAPSVWHINEGHAAFLLLERCREYVREGMDFDGAFELTGANTAFTTHTPVAAGHDVFKFVEVQAYLGALIAELGISAELLAQIGSVPETAGGFSMTSLALRGSRYRNGVSEIHGRIAARMSSYVWPEVPTMENPMGYVTNGADVSTYLAAPWESLFEMYMGGGWRSELTDPGFWRNFIDSIPNHVFLSVRQILKVSMLENVKQRAMEQLGRYPMTQSISERLTEKLDNRSKDTLVIGFARRFATYKRATLIFSDLPRLARLLNDPERPVMLVFAGKAHPNDKPGQQLLREIFDITLMPEFQGKVFLLENYNLSMARDLLSGVDVWLNNPEYPMEACGTSGMKAAINGAANLSVLDGWWAEAWDGTNGWGLKPYLELSPEDRREREAGDLLNVLEYQVIPAYYQRNDDGEPDHWLAIAKASMKTVLPRFNTIRMAKDYLAQLYAPAARLGRILSSSQAYGAIELAAWKRKIDSSWDGLSCKLVNPVPASIGSGQVLPLDVCVELNGLSSEDIIVECVVGDEGSSGQLAGVHQVQFEIQAPVKNGTAIYHCDLFQNDILCSASGLQNFRIRLYPYHTLLNHRFECGRMLWL